MKWSKGRGALGRMQPLIGRWRNEGKGEGASGVRCTRQFEMFGPDYVRLEASWDMTGRGAYREIALFGKNEEGVLAFWSFTSDGKKSEGVLDEATDVHADAICFVAKMPAGTARMIYWPDEAGEGFHFAVENKVKKGWNRFFEHHYTPLK